jgi:DNA-binding Lrp family transcriptional regulator
VVAFSSRTGSTCAKIYVVDAIDRKILAVLQEEARLTVTELAARIPLGVSRCQRGLRELETNRVVRGYRAVLDCSATLDYVLHVVAADLAARRRIYDEHLPVLPGVPPLSTLVMKEVVSDRGSLLEVHDEIVAMRESSRS